MTRSAVLVELVGIKSDSRVGRQRQVDAPRLVLIGVASSLLATRHDKIEPSGASFHIPAQMISWVFLGVKKWLAPWKLVSVMERDVRAVIQGRRLLLVRPCA